MMSDLKSKCIKQSKPFSSLAYLAKSSAALHGNKADAPSAPPGRTSQLLAAATNGSSSKHTRSNTNGHSCPSEVATNAESSSLGRQAALGRAAGGETSLSRNSSASSSSSSNCDVVDGGERSRRCPWAIGKHVRATLPPSSPALASGNYNDSYNAFASLSTINSLDNWDYTVELECLQGPQDLQLAAELGKTLLERNKELETLLKEYKNTVEEQEQEIVYLKKHTTALREVNDSRLKVYEQLEVGIQDLERANHRLLVENTSDKKHIKTLTHNIESLETRCDDLTKQLEEVRHSLAVERRRNERLLQEKNEDATEQVNAVQLRPVANTKRSSAHESSQDGFDADTTAPENCSFAFQSPDERDGNNLTGVSSSDATAIADKTLNLSCVSQREDNEEIIKLVTDLEVTRKAFVTEQQRCGELEEQLVAIIQENQSLQGRMAQNNTIEEMKSMHDELSILDEVRQGQMCCRCLRAVDDRNTINDEQSSIAPTEEDDEDEEERSLLDVDAAASETNCSEAAAAAPSQTASALRAGVSIKVTPRAAPDTLDLNAPPASPSPNPYRDLVEKYEALLEVQRSSVARKSGNGRSLAEEFQAASSESFNAETQKLMLQAAEAAVEAAAVASSGNCNASSNSSCNGSSAHPTASSKHRGRTPTEFSEAETSSSGFADETSNKSTQTEHRPGYFLCSIGDGEDCKFSIYDDASQIDSRFRNRPEYRQLFKEIFAVLKKAAENKEEGDKLPLLDDAHPHAANASVPPVTPANEEQPALEFGDDALSIISSAVSEQSFAMSECITKLERKTAKKHITEKNQENSPAMALAAQKSNPSVVSIVENGRVLTPLKRESLEYLSVGVAVKKKNRKKNRNFGNDRAESPVALPSPPRVFVMTGKKRKDMRPFVQSPVAASPEQPRSQRGGNAKFEWNGSSMVIYNRSMASPQQLRGQRGRDLDAAAVSLDYRPSTVSQDLHKLKKLDLSYAEVLRRADSCKHSQQHHHRRKNQQQHH